MRSWLTARTTFALGLGAWFSRYESSMYTQACMRLPSHLRLLRLLSVSSVIVSE
jgi:hypothetical protein